MQSPPDPVTDLTVYDAEELFYLAGERERRGNVDGAIAVYERLLDQFEASELGSAARFNLGLLWEAKRDFGRAVGVYQALIQAGRGTTAAQERTWLDAHFRLAVSHGQLEAWWQTVAVFDRVLAFSFLEDSDRLEAMVGRGIAIQEAGELLGAESALYAALHFFRIAEQRGPTGGEGWAAEAAFRLGDIVGERYRAVTLQFPPARLQQALETKCQTLLVAQRHYLQAVRYGDAHTVAAAGYQIGNLYETLYDTIVALEAPGELTADEVETYRSEVHRRVRVLVEKALKTYERALLVGQHAKTADTWRAKLEAAIDRLRSLVLWDVGPASIGKGG